MGRSRAASARVRTMTERWVSTEQASAPDFRLRGCKMQRGYFVGLGSNLDPHDNVPKAVLALTDSFGPVEVSRIVETAPTAGFERTFLNAVAYVRSELEPAALKAELCRIEIALGRDRDHPDRAKQDRTVDLDILLEVPLGADRIAAGAVSEEPYYRPSMMELIGVMGL